LLPLILVCTQDAPGLLCTPLPLVIIVVLVLVLVLVLAALSHQSLLQVSSFTHLLHPPFGNPPLSSSPIPTPSPLPPLRGMSSTLTTRVRPHVSTVMPRPAQSPVDSVSVSASVSAAASTSMPAPRLDASKRAPQVPAPTTAAAAAAAAADASRGVLSRVNLNVSGASAASAAAAATLAKRAASGRGKPPGPAAGRDARDARDGGDGRDRAASGSHLGKRARDAPPARTPSASATAPSAPKRARAEEERAIAARHRLTQESWREKWLKTFPTLIFYFELGADEGVGRGLRQRVLNMGAVSSAG
jgi:hypothetical protein